MKIRRRTLLAGSGAALASWPLAGLARTLGYPRVMHGPMIGVPGATHINVWARVSGALSVQVEYSHDRAFRDTKTTTPVTAAAANDFIVQTRIDGLAPDTHYYYRVLVDGIVDRYQPTPYMTKTAPGGVAEDAKRGGAHASRPFGGRGGGAGRGQVGSASAAQYVAVQRPCPVICQPWQIGHHGAVDEEPVSVGPT